jgi:hypothetical protein
MYDDDLLLEEVGTGKHRKVTDYGLRVTTDWEWRSLFLMRVKILVTHLAYYSRATDHRDRCRYSVHTFLYRV